MTLKPPDPATTGQPVSVRAAAEHFGVDPKTVRSWVRHGCPCVRRGRSGPGRGALLSLFRVEEWRKQRRARTTLPTESIGADMLDQIATALLKSLSEDSSHIGAGATVTRAEAAAILLSAWERICKTFGKTYRFDVRPPAIQTLRSEL